MIVTKLSSYKMKERILAEAKKRKPNGIQIYEDFSKATVEIRKKNWKKVKELRAQNKYAFLVYDKKSPQTEICRFSNYKFCFVKYLVLI